MTIMHGNKFAVFILIFGLLFTACSHQENINSERETQHPLLLISFDGFMNEYIERNETPNFDQFISNGIKAEYLIPVFPTKTFPNHYTIVTGLYAENHGIIANSFYDYELDARFSYGPENSPNDERWWGGEPIWITTEKQNKTAATFFWPGSEASIQGVQSTKWKDYDGSVPNAARIDSVISWIDPKGPVQADFSSLYFSFVDNRGHEFGPGSAEVDRAVRRADALLGYLYKKMDEFGLKDSINVIITSDHGMAELSEERVIFLDEIINLDDVDVIDWTPVAMLRPVEGRTREIYETLKENEKHYRVYRKNELPEQYHFSNHYRIPEIVMIADAGYTITGKSFFNGRLPAATHGFDHTAPEMRTFFAANGPAFKSGERVEPFQAVHIYELMCEILNLEPSKNDGDLNEVRHLLKN